MSSEFRQDPVSGEWVLIASGRAKRPQPSDHQAAILMPQDQCPFEPDRIVQQEVLWRHPRDREPEVTVIKNKFPAVEPGICGPDVHIGPFKTHPGAGSHDIFVFRDHDRDMSELSLEQVTCIVEAYKKRSQEIRDTANACARYIMLFHNSGAEAGASISHPHSQILSTPILPPDIYRSLYGSYNFYKQTGKKVHKLMLDWELTQQRRIIYENQSFIALCPFVSRSPYEVRIFPKDHGAYFHDMANDRNADFADALKVVLRRMRVALNQPAYNFYFHSAPLETELGDVNDFYSWHVEILPKVSIPAGFEIATGVHINAMDPDEAARTLREIPV